jgi:hypothetical protein
MKIYSSSSAIPRSVSDLEQILHSLRVNDLHILLTDSFDAKMKQSLKVKNLDPDTFHVIIETNKKFDQNEYLHSSSSELLDVIELINSYLQKNLFKEIKFFYNIHFNIAQYISNKALRLINLSTPTIKLNSNVNGDLLVYVDTITHLRKARMIEEALIDKNLIYVTSKKDIFSLLNPNKDFFCGSPILLFKTILKLRSLLFAGIIVSRVDDLYFQIIYKIMKFNSLYTFDEGLFAIEPNSIYNSQIEIKFEYGILYFILSKILGFPIGAAQYYKKTEKHFTWFDRNLFKRTVIDDSKLIQLKDNADTKPINRIFIGQPWQFMGLDDQAINSIGEFINSSRIDLYISHPREDNNIMGSLINPSIARISNLTSGEIFLSKIIQTSNPDLYTLASTIVTNLPSTSKINIIKSRFFGEQVMSSQKNLLSALEHSNTKFICLSID